MSPKDIPHVLDWFSTPPGLNTKLEIITDLALPGMPNHNAEAFYDLTKRLGPFLGRDGYNKIGFHYKECPIDA